MIRREFITLLGGAAAFVWPLVARAQQAVMPVIGFLNASSVDGYSERLRAFRQGLKETGYIDGESVAIEYRWAEGHLDRLPGLAADLVRRRVAVIAALGGPAQALAAKSAIAAIPVVFLVGEDPVRLGLVASLAWPGGNLTGINSFSGEVAAKRLNLLRELAPVATRVAVLVNPANASDSATTLRDVQAAARNMGLQIQVLNASTSGEIDAAFATFAGERPDALLVGGDSFFNSRLNCHLVAGRSLIDLVASKLALRAPTLRVATALTRPDRSAQRLPCGRHNMPTTKTVGPKDIVANHCVEHGDHLAHHRHDHDLRQFAGGCETIVERLEWDGIYDDGAQPVNGQSFNVHIRLLDYAGTYITIPGRQTEDYQENAIVINVTTVTIGAAATPAVLFDKLKDGMAVVNLPVTIDTPAGAAVPDKIELEVLDAATDIALGTVPVAGFPPSITWHGELGGGLRILAANTFKLRVVARKGAAVLARSNTHIVKVLAFELVVSSANAISRALMTIHPIAWAGPTMPVLTVHSRLIGLLPEDEEEQQRDVRLQVSQHAGTRNDDYFLPGPTAATWRVLDPAEEWTVASWSTDFRGDDLTVFTQANVDGVLLEGKTVLGAHKIWGENPPKASVRAALGDLSHQVVGWQESRFTQFRDGANIALLNNYDIGPFVVLTSFDAGFGIGQLTNPVPTVDELWNWKANVAATLSRLDTFRADALVYQNQVRAGTPWNAQTGGVPPALPAPFAFPGAPAFTADQLDLEMWSRYNSGFRYHDYDAVHNAWKPRLPPPAPANTGSHYAETLAAIKQQVVAGMLPAGW